MRVLGRPTMDHLCKLAETADRNFHLTMCIGKASILRTGLQKLVRASGGALWYRNACLADDMRVSVLVIVWDGIL